MSISGVISSAAAGVAHHHHHRGQEASQTSNSSSAAQTQTQSTSDSANTANTTSQAQNTFLALLGSLAISGSPLNTVQRQRLQQPIPSGHKASNRGIRARCLSPVRSRALFQSFDGVGGERPRKIISTPVSVIGGFVTTRSFQPKLPAHIKSSQAHSSPVSPGAGCFAGRWTLALQWRLSPRKRQRGLTRWRSA